MTYQFRVLLVTVVATVGGQGPLGLVVTGRLGGPRVLPVGGALWGTTEDLDGVTHTPLDVDLCGEAVKHVNKGHSTY